MKNDPPKTQRCTCPTHPAEAQAVAWQFQDREGKWHGFTDERHRQNTIADGSWPIRALYAAPPSAPVGVPVDVVREYLDARACYEAATRPPNSHARAPVLKHDDPDAQRLREARVALDNAIALAQQPAADLLVEALSHARENAAYLGTGEVVLQLDGAEWMTKAEEALAQQPAADFDAWRQNPYTKLLMKSIDEDFVPKHDQQPAAVDEADAKDAENERLRAERDSFQRVGIAAQARADRLAEALREKADKWDRIGDEHGVRQFTGNDHKLFANELRAALRDHDQESGNG